MATVTHPANIKIQAQGLDDHWFQVEPRITAPQAVTYLTAKRVARYGSTPVRAIDATTGQPITLDALRAQVTEEAMRAEVDAR